MMYSTSPHLIKHFVPIAFSQNAVDYQEPRRRKSMATLQENPLQNKKLRNISDVPKDYVLIFKNKSCKDFSPRKKIKYSPAIDQFRRVPLYDDDQQEFSERQAEHQKQNCDRKDDQKNALEPSFKIMRPSSLSTANMTRRSFSYNNNEQRDRPRRDIQTPNSIQELINNYSSVKQSEANKANSSPSWRGGRIISSSTKKFVLPVASNKYQFGRTSEEDSQQMMTKTLLSLKVCGKRAPKSETLDHFKKLTVDPHFSLVSRIIK